ncbi:tetratricopeptide repeat-containing sensor histidine kinase [Algoriphagus antarcticus]|nr:tetratricopeptide repeat protein [Algoriphagus antarcticus]
MNFFKYLLLIFLLSVTFINGSLAQTTKTDSLLLAIKKLNDDSVKVTYYLDLGLELMGSNTKQSIFYLDEAIKLASKINYKKGLANAYNAKGRAYAQQGNFQEASLNFPEALKYFREINDKTGEANMLSNLGSIYFMVGYNSKALELHFESLKISEELDNKLRIGTSLNNIGTVYLENRSTINEALTFFTKSLEVFQGIEEQTGMAIAAMNIGEVYFIESKYDSAIYFHQMALELCDETIDATFPLTQLGEIYTALGNFQKAFGFHRRALEISERFDAKFELTQVLIGLAKTQKKQEDFEGAINTLERAKLLAIEIDAKDELVDVYINLAETQALVGDYKAAYENGVNAKSKKEEIAKSNNQTTILLLQFEFELDKKEAEIALLQKDTDLKNAAVFNQRIIIFASLVGLFMFVIISISLFRNNMSKQKANRLLQLQKEEIHAQRENVESAYVQLKSAQAQLIHSEKMSSLGELTAGIAHEIQNPLNFVNNFSEVSAELMLELKSERSKENSDRNETVEEEIIGDVIQNLNKITLHGKRADAIVKGMLEHSRKSEGSKTPTDLNALADKYLKLSYNGLRAKDKNFNANFITELDPDLPMCEVVPQDIGRVLLNLINNAFYAVNEKAKSGIAGPDYNPTIKVSTSYSPLSGGRAGSVKISVSDNGSGVPDSNKEKIFQPFFTTKPTGQGTGLGLSLSYDIVKAHGGELKVESKEGEGSEFMILLPL